MPTTENDTVAIDGRVTTYRHKRSRRLVPSSGVVGLWSSDALGWIDCTPATLRLACAADQVAHRCRADADPVLARVVADRHLVVLFRHCAACSRREMSR